MSLAKLRSMGFPALDIAEAEKVVGEGLSAAQCAHIKALSYSSAVVSCGGHPSDYTAIYNRECKK
ncbi:hypothetical protein ADK86_24255 [Streptomyces sp. NRRL F-5755]|uniref:hypothetical protein n=1 Tax=Streptomyces sp. NRRL F-5755 TaxID=1519475 RepID=UPI0006AFCCE0|nr:hypothetical protein [Streptomyces sp. NRRL F-5755]KOT91076.1 hypothetical protein ADK86_24255 [Streptomyces sp. NRRL F-5755]